MQNYHVFMLFFARSFFLKNERNLPKPAKQFVVLESVFQWSRSQSCLHVVSATCSDVTRWEQSADSSLYYWLAARCVSCQVVTMWVVWFATTQSFHTVTRHRNSDLGYYSWRAAIAVVATLVLLLLYSALPVSSI